MADRNPDGRTQESRPGRSHVKIDAHQHFWRYSAAEFGWIGEHRSQLKRDYLPDELRATISRSGVEGTITVQARQSEEETESLLDLADRWSFVRGVVGWLPIAADDFGERLDRLAGRAKLRGLRHVVQDESDEEFLLRPEFNRGIDKLLARGLTYDILVFERQLPQVIGFVDMHPYQTFVLDHCGKPRVGDREMEPWRSRMEELAERINVYCKISGLVTESQPGQWKPEDIVPYIEAAIDLFGPERVMFGSDWPVCLTETDYRGWLSLCAGHIESYSQSEQRRFWADTAREAYRL